MSVLASMLVAMTMMMQGIDETGTAVASPTGEVHFNPDTGSYYQVFQFIGKPPHTWEHAARMVKGYQYEGRVGQLAVIRDIATHYFLLLKFPILRQQKLWIGLGVTCEKKASILDWVDGTSLADQSFRGFGEGVLREVSRTCRTVEYSKDTYPIFYEPDAFGVRWQLGRPKDNLLYMMVEFAKPKDDTEEKGASPDAASEASNPQ